MFLFGDMKILNKILKSKDVNLEKLYKKELYIKKDFEELNEIVSKIILRNEEDSNIIDNKQKKEGVRTIPKLNIKNVQKNKRIIKFSELPFFNNIELQS